MTTQPPAADSVMDIHSCSYYCQLPKCVLRQRDELVRVYVEGWKEKEPVTPPAVEGDDLARFLIRTLLMHMTIDCEDNDVFSHWKGERRSVKAMATEYLGSKK